MLYLWLRPLRRMLCVVSSMLLVHVRYEVNVNEIRIDNFEIQNV